MWIAIMERFESSARFCAGVWRRKGLLSHVAWKALLGSLIARVVAFMAFLFYNKKKYKLGN